MRMLKAFRPGAETLPPGSRLRPVKMTAVDWGDQRGIVSLVDFTMTSSKCFGPVASLRIAAVRVGAAQGVSPNQGGCCSRGWGW